ncbi:MAG: hypothetical protein WBA23_02665, partial [Tunicatimonas sp.]|uniref:hypothetical protein n=1 Tax=Tunicatimonas sp. TaxID=1940096 RepID=UPI003C787235
MKRWILSFGSLLLFSCQSSENVEIAEETEPSQYVDAENPIYQILAERDNEMLDSVINHPETFELQIFYTQIDR